MITLIQGNTGSGKTWLTTRLAYKAWRKGATIYTNYSLNFGDDNDGIVRWHNLDELFHLKNGIILIDDAIKLLDATKWYLLPTSFKEKIAGHRHDYIDIITNIQDFYQIHIDIRRNVHSLINMQNIYRSSKNDRVAPALQIIRAIKKIRQADFDNERTRWTMQGSPSYYILSKFFTKQHYNTYDNIYLNRFICALTYEMKPTMKRGQWAGKIYSREMVNQGKARI